MLKKLERSARRTSIPALPFSPSAQVRDLCQTPASPFGFGADTALGDFFMKFKCYFCSSS